MVWATLFSSWFSSVSEIPDPLHPRVLYEPATFTTYAGQDAIRFRLVDLSSTETLTILAHPQTLHLMAATQK